MKQAHYPDRISHEMTFPPDYAPDYRALRDGAAIADVASRAQIGVAGRDRRSYLQGLLTNDIEALQAGSGCYAAWLTPQGRLITDLQVFESGDMVLLDVPAELAEALVQRLDQFLFGEDVQLSDLRGALTGLSVHGPDAARVVEAALTGVSGLAGWPSHHNARATFGASPVVVARVDQLGVPGYTVYAAHLDVAALTAALEAAGAVRAGREAVDAARIEAGTSVFGRDMTDDTIPLEAGIEQQAISFTKGCYVGQEVIIRVLHRGGGRVAKKLVALRIEGNAPAAGDQIFAGEKAIGSVTSSATSPRFGAIALGYVHRDFLEPGTQVEIGERRQAAIVSARPLTA